MASVAGSGQGHDGGRLYEVVAERVAVRAEASTKSRALAILRRGAHLRGLESIEGPGVDSKDGLPWLRLVPGQLPEVSVGRDAWVLLDASGAEGALSRLGQLVRPKGGPAFRVLHDIAANDSPGLLEQVANLRRSTAGLPAGAPNCGCRIDIVADASGSSVLAYCCYLTPDPEKSCVLAIAEIVVAGDQRKQGLGTMLILDVLDTAVGLGMSKLILPVSEESRGAFSSLGFQYMADDVCAGLGHLEMCLRHGASLRAFEKFAADDTAEPPVPREPGVPGLCCFVASHVSSQGRLQRLANMLVSVVQQAPAGPCWIFVSWSATSSMLQERVRSLMKGAAKHIPALRAIEQRQPRSQFLHLRACASAAMSMEDLPSDAWVMFSDDDDLWHPHRCSEYRGAISEIHADAAVVTVMATRHAVLAPQRTWEGSEGAVIVDAREVSQMVQSQRCLFSDPGHLMVRDLQEASCTPSAPVTNYSGPEYFDMAIRLRTFGQFLSRTDTCILSSRFCDRHFLGRFCLPAESGKTHWFCPEGWLYFYSRRLKEVSRWMPGMIDGGACFGVDVTAADRRLAAEHTGICNRGFTADDLGFLAAKFRAAIEEQLLGGIATRVGWIGKQDLLDICKTAVSTRDVDNCEADSVLALAQSVASEVCGALQLAVKD